MTLGLRSTAPSSTSKSVSTRGSVRGRAKESLSSSTGRAKANRPLERSSCRAERAGGHGKGSGLLALDLHCGSTKRAADSRKSSRRAFCCRSTSCEQRSTKRRAAAPSQCRKERRNSSGQRLAALEEEEEEPCGHWHLAEITQAEKGGGGSAVEDEKEEGEGVELQGIPGRGRNRPPTRPNSVCSLCRSPEGDGEKEEEAA